MIPEGDFDGIVLGRWSFLNRIWKGKVFEGSTVRNKVLGHLWIRGTVHVVPPLVHANFILVKITYWFGLTDWLTPSSDDGSKWEGCMAIGPIVIDFRLTKKVNETT